ncbi:TlpA family protein disulfide reductase [Halobacteria archaeon AArc-curdl1]|uniref:TlpA family protein disulfide reductase n=1 Tax=Natronosalvus hydrolyticus TaxID=2979988 RepID=A0AAP2Z4U0_9EURY|nr:TlpA family protein disulfide reductase [Halobacteria archaeon AArc-curdl1]
MTPPSRRVLLGLLASGAIAGAGCLDDSSEGETDENDHDERGPDTDADDTEGTETSPSGTGNGADDTEEPDGDEDDSDQSNSDEDSRTGSVWETTELEDVLTGESFTVADFDRPVFLETFAVWCSTCRQQQYESATLHERTGDEIVTVGLNVDPNEDAEAVREHANEHGFDWYFSVAPPEVTRSLVDEFGESMANPPSAPIVLRCPDGTARRLEDGVKSADTLEAALEEGC